MNRTTTVALVAAALVGTIGGSMTAVVRDRAASAGPPSSTASPSVRSPAGQTPTPSASPSPEPTPSATPTALPLLYADDGVIHDGKKQIRYDLPVDSPRRLVRTRDGYLVSYILVEGGVEVGYRLVAVTPDGTTTKVADMPTWYFDLDERGSRVVGVDRKSDRLTVWDLRGRVLAEAPRDKVTEVQPVFHQDAVFFGGLIDTTGADSWLTWAWDLRTGAVRRIDEGAGGMAELAGSADGSLLVGDIGSDGSATDEEARICSQVVSTPGAPEVRWRTCDWHRFASPWSFSPDGTRLLMIAADTPVGGESDYGGATFAIFSATTGPSDGVTRIKAPDGTTSASWLGADRLLFETIVYGAGEVDNGQALRECTLDGRCRVVARKDKGWLTVGEQY